jgi:hypothetical protein
MGFVRCKGPDGAEFTIDEAAAKRMGVKVLDKPAVDRSGRPLPAKPATKLDGKPAGSASTDKPKEG